ncbi:MAG: hypothetical protein AB8B87_20945 [Granulosicoccus sp.]
MNKSRTVLISMFIASTTLVGCGGGGGGVTEQAGEVATTATDAAADVASEASDAIADTAGAIGDAIDPAAWQDIEMNWDSQISSVQGAFPDLSVDEIVGTAGKPQNLVSLIEQKYGITREDAMQRVSEWASSL